MLDYVVGVESSLQECVITAMDMQGNILHKESGRSTNHLSIGKKAAQTRLMEMFDGVIDKIGAQKSGCRCVVAGVVGIDSPNMKAIVSEYYMSLRVICPIFCLNDGSVALYATTRGLGVLAISGSGSIAVGRNAKGDITRSGGYPISIFGNEGSGQWIALNAMRLVSQWIDGSIEKTPLIEKMDRYFKGLDVNKLTDCGNTLKRRPVDLRIADLVMDAATEGDEMAAALLKQGAAALFEVADTSVRKLGFDREKSFLSGVWGNVFTRSAIYFSEYKALFEARYPASQVVFPESDPADGAARMALEYLAGKIPFINDLQ